MHYSVQTRDRIFVKDYGFLFFFFFFGKNLGKKICKNISRTLNFKYSPGMYLCCASETSQSKI